MANEDVLHAARVRDDAANLARLRADNRFRAITESALDAIVSTGSDGRIYGWNPAATRIFGWTEKEAVGMPLAALMPERARAGHVEEFSKFLRTKKSNIVGRTVEFVGLRKDRTEFPCENSISTWSDGTGRFVTSIIRDITARKEAEQRIQRLNRDFRNLVDNIPRPIMVSRDGCVVFVNQVFCFWYGFQSPQPLLGRPILDFLAEPAQRAALRDRLVRVQDGEIVPEQFWMIRMANGSVRKAEVSSVPVEFDGAPSLVAIFTEVAEPGPASIPSKSPARRTRTE